MSKNTIIKLTKPISCTKLYFKDDLIGLSLCVEDSSNSIDACIPSTSYAFIALIAGEVTIRSTKTSNVNTMVAGESFVIPKGHNIHWQSCSPLLKICLIYTPITDETIPTSSANNHIIGINQHSHTPWQQTSDGFRKKVQYQSYNQKFTVGVWQGADFKTGMITFPYNEFILVKHGCLVCTDEQGEVHKINVGEALLVPQGVCCAWQAQGKVSLQFVQIRP